MTSSAIGSEPIRCIIYDLDGVLLDTEPFYTEVTQEIVGQWGKVFDWSIKSNMIGRKSIDSARYLVEALELPISPEEYLAMRKVGLDERFRRTPEMPGAKAFTDKIAALGVTQGIATSSERVQFELKASSHPRWFENFSVCVTGDDPRVGTGKPAPDIFLVAAEALGFAPETCLVFEDSPAGVEAARAAGMRVIALPDPNMSRDRYARAHAVADGFPGVDPASLPLLSDNA